MRYNDYDTILTRMYKKEQDQKLNIRIRNAKSIINNDCPVSYIGMHGKTNKFRKNGNIGKK